MSLSIRGEPEAPTLSVVISTYNRWQLLELCVLALYQTRAEQRKWECIVVDDGSTDDTLAWLARWRHERSIRGITNFRHVRRLLNVGKPNCVALPRNCGLQQARGDYVAFMDGDCIACSDVVDGTIKWARWDSAHKAKRFLTSGCWWRMNRRALGKGAYYPFGPRGADASVPFGPWFAVKREPLIEMGGFDERFTTYGAEDEDMVTRIMRLGYQPERSAGTVFMHLWHPPGVWSRDELQHATQMKITRDDKTNVRNVGVEWGRLI